MSSVYYEIFAYGLVSANGFVSQRVYDETPRAIVASGRLTATTTVPSDIVTVPAANADDKLVLTACIDSTGAAGETVPYRQSYIAIAEIGSTPRPDINPRAQVNGFKGTVSLIVKSGQSFRILDTGKSFGSLTVPTT